MLYYCSVFFFFFKQKTAYEMRISDWSSDVCSSDLLDLQALVAADQPGGRRAIAHLVPRGRVRIQGAEHGPGHGKMEQAHAVKGEHGDTGDGHVGSTSKDGPVLSYVCNRVNCPAPGGAATWARSEEHTYELQS